MFEIVIKHVSDLRRGSFIDSWRDDGDDASLRDLARRGVLSWPWGSGERARVPRVVHERRIPRRAP